MIRRIKKIIHFCSAGLGGMALEVLYSVIIMLGVLIICLLVSQWKFIA